MLSPGITYKLSSVLAADVTATTVTPAESGLSVNLAPNTAYQVKALLMTTSSGDGIRFAPMYSTLLSVEAIGCIYSIASSATYNIEDEITDATANAEWHWDGIVQTASAGRLYITWAKNTDVGGDSTLTKGSYLIARPL